jgi:hypothetical protein
MKFFNESVSNSLQYITLILEVAGITLAFIEIKSPSSADKIEKAIRGVQKFTERASYKVTRSHAGQTFITLFIILLFAAVVPTVWGLFTLPWYLWLLFGIVGAIFGIILGLHLTVDFINSLNKFSNGKAIGALGICLASLGMVGEAYQILFIWFG